MDYKSELNRVNKSSFKRRLSTTSDAFSDIQDAVIKTLYEDELDLTGIFDGVVLQNVDTELNPFGDWASKSKAVLTILGIDSVVRKYKVRVPGVHDLIPAPQHSNDCIAISMHHTFSETVDIGNRKDLVCGEIVKVSFIDGSGRFNPRIVERIPSKNPVCIFSDSPRLGTGNLDFDANISKARGDALGKGRKCIGNQIPRITSNPDAEQITDDVLKWLPIIRGVRNNLLSKTGIDFSYIADETVLAMIEIESGGKTGRNHDTSIRGGDHSRYYGILQQDDANIHFAYDWNAGRPVRKPFAASNLINFPGHVDEHLGKRIHQTTGTEAENKVVKDLNSVPHTRFESFEQAGATAIQTAFLNWHRAKKDHEGIPSLISSYHNGGFTPVRLVKKRANEEGVKFGEAAILLSREGKISAKVSTYINDFNEKSVKWRQKINEYNPEAAIIEDEPCEEFNETDIDSNQVALDSDDTLQAFLDKNGIKHFKATELLSRSPNNRAKNVEPPQELWPNIILTLKLADKIRDIIGKEITITSAYRSPEYNASLEGAKPNSEHVQFKALDLKYSNYEELKAVGAAVMNNAVGYSTGMGFYEDKKFIHIDTNSEKANIRRWGGAPEPTETSQALPQVVEEIDEEGDIAAAEIEGEVVVYQKLADWYNNKLPASSQLTLEDIDIIAPFILNEDGEIDYTEASQDNPVLSSGNTFTFDDGTPVTKQRLIERILERNR